jgi:hypothetical protein
MMRTLPLVGFVWAITIASAQNCPEVILPPGCQSLADFAGGSANDPTKDLKIGSCVHVPSGSYFFRYVNVVQGGWLFFDDPSSAQSTAFNAKSILVEEGGKVQAGAYCRPFGQNGGKLAIGLWGDDPTSQGTIPNPTDKGIQCQSGLGTTGCYNDQRVGRICEVAPGGDLSDPCNADRPASGFKDNELFEGYANLPIDPNFFGYKVLGVSYGGSLKLFGKKGVLAADFLNPNAPMASCPVPPVPMQNNVQAWASLSGNSWAVLNSSAASNQPNLTLDRPVDWAAGDQIVVATTDWNASHSELATVSQNSAGNLVLSVNLQFPHQGQTMPVRAGNSGNPNTEIDLRGAVGLLSRSITIRSLGATADASFPAASACGSDVPGCYFGGHLIARQGFAQFQLQGVELYQLGQGGRMGHYPIHFHMAKATNYNPYPVDLTQPKAPLGNAFVKDSSIWESNARFITVHATHDVTLARNVGYLSLGHAFYLEDGTEINNLLCQNLGVTARPSTLEYFSAQPATAPTHRRIPPILAEVRHSGNDVRPFRGSDGLFPSMFWIMNAYNEFVGNKAVGVGGFGTCYWLFSPTITGLSAGLHWSRMGPMQQTHSPLDYANFQPGGRQPPLKRFRGNSCSTAGYGLSTQIDYQTVPPSGVLGGTPVANPYAAQVAAMAPLVEDNFLPMNFVPSGNLDPICAPSNHAADNSAGCSTTIIDRFTTSFNWAETNFGSVWLRPGNFLFLNSAITDQLYGGLVFVTGGSPEQALPRNLMIAKNSVFAGSSRQPNDLFGSRTGPSMDPNQCNGEYCAFPADGTILYMGAFQPKRLLSIYDGPFFSDGNVFQGTESFTCNPWDGGASCGIYKDTNQPLCGTPNGQNPNQADPSCVIPSTNNPAECGVTDRPKMLVIDAAIGWKQPNGFYYPPTFAFRNSNFVGATERHNVMDQYRTYVKAVVPGGMNICAPLRDPTNFGGVTPIDFTTILNDLDGTLNGVVPSQGASLRSNGISRNYFHKAPNQAPQCSSFGTDTAPFEMVTSVAARLSGAPTATTSVDFTWMGQLPMVPIYRQLKTADAADACPSNPAICNGANLGCPRGSFMMGASNGQAPALTTNHGVYFIDTSTTESASCIDRQSYQISSFEANKSYVLYHLFATSATSVTYQLYVGENFVPATNAQWVRVQVHKGNLNMEVDPSTVALGQVRFGAKDGLPPGILQATLDNATVAEEYQFSAVPAGVQCQPRDICSPQNGKCVLASAFPEAGLSSVVGDVCNFWATRTTGMQADGVFLSDCPTNGCIGLAFTIPAGFAANTGYAASGGAGLVNPYPSTAPWNVGLKSVDARCAVPGSR